MESKANIQRQINPAHLPLYLRIKFLDEWVVVQGGVVDRSEFCQSRRRKSNEKKSGALPIEGQTNRFCTLLLLFHIIINVKLRSPTPSLPAD